MSTVVAAPDKNSRATDLRGARRKSGGGAASALKVRFLGVLVFLVLLGGAFAVASPRFLTAGNITTVLYTAAILAIAAAGQTLVVLTGNLDLSVGSVMGLVAYVMYDLSGRFDGLHGLVLPIGLVIGALLGLFNGVLVAILDIPAIVATLGTMAVYRGITTVYSNAGQVTSGDIPNWMIKVATGDVLGLPYYVLVAAAVIAAGAGALRSLPWGRRLYALGSNPRAAQFFGLDSKRIVLGAYVGSGIVSALAGLMLGAQVGTVSSQLANGYEMSVLAAVVVGGVSIWGGSGSVLGAALGAVVLATINNGLVLMQVHEFYQLLIQGAAIVLAVGVDAIVQRRVSRVTSRRNIMQPQEAAQ
jgi:rhamnose transport system permease protein